MTFRHYSILGMSHNQRLVLGAEIVGVLALVGIAYIWIQWSKKEEKGKKQDEENNERRQPTEVEPYPTESARGLENLGNTCYFNSTMQPLVHTHFVFREELQNIGEQGEFVKEVLKFFSAMQSSDSGPCSPDDLHGLFGTKSPKFANFRQHDSHECLRNFLDNVRTEERDNSGAADKRKVLTVVDSVFGGHFMTVYICKECETPYHVCEALLDVSLPIMITEKDLDAMYSAGKTSRTVKQQTRKSQINRTSQKRNDAHTSQEQQHKQREEQHHDEQHFQSTELEQEQRLTEEKSNTEPRPKYHEIQELEGKQNVHNTEHNQQHQIAQEKHEHYFHNTEPDEKHQKGLEQHDEKHVLNVQPEKQHKDIEEQHNSQCTQNIELQVVEREEEIEHAIVEERQRDEQEDDEKENGDNDRVQLHEHRKLDTTSQALLKDDNKVCDEDNEVEDEMNEGGEDRVYKAKTKGDDEDGDNENGREHAADEDKQETVVENKAEVESKERYVDELIANDNGEDDDNENDDNKNEGEAKEDEDKQETVVENTAEVEIKDGNVGKLIAKDNGEDDDNENEGEVDDNESESEDEADKQETVVEDTAEVEIKERTVGEVIANDNGEDDDNENDETENKGEDEADEDKQETVVENTAEVEIRDGNVSEVIANDNGEDDDNENDDNKNEGQDKEDEDKQETVVENTAEVEIKDRNVGELIAKDNGEDGDNENKSEDDDSESESEDEADKQETIVENKAKVEYKNGNLVEFIPTDNGEDDKEVNSEVDVENEDEVETEDKVENEDEVETEDKADEHKEGNVVKNETQIESEEANATEVKTKSDDEEHESEVEDEDETDDVTEADDEQNSEEVEVEENCTVTKDSYREAVDKMMMPLSMSSQYLPRSKTVKKKQITICDCLMYFTRKEHIDKEYLCNDCYRKYYNENGGEDILLTSATKQTLIFNPPAILTLHLKRFELKPGGSVKRTDMITYEELLDIAPYCSSMCLRNNPQCRNIWYSLYGVVVHHGSTLKSGHYMAYVKIRGGDVGFKKHLQEKFFDRDLTREQLIEMMQDKHLGETHRQPGETLRQQGEPRRKPGTWYCMNDSWFHEVSVEEVLNQEAYLLFFERM